jgi:hypothetical protein
MESDATTNERGRIVTVPIETVDVVKERPRLATGDYFDIREVDGRHAILLVAQFRDYKGRLRSG